MTIKEQLEKGADFMKDIAKTDPLKLLYLVYILVIIACIYVFMVIFKLKGEYDYGAGLQKQCSPVFMEKERGDHQAYIAYTTSASKTLADGYALLSICVIIIILSYWLWLLQKIVTSWNTDIDKMEMLFYKEIDATTLNKGGLMFFIKIGIPIILLVALSAFLIEWIFANHGTKEQQEKLNLTPFKTFTSITQTPVNFDPKEIKKTKHDLDIRLNWFIFGIILCGMYFYNPKFKTTDPIQSNYIPVDANINIHILWLIMFVLVYYLFDMVVLYQDRISYHYGTYKQELNEMIKSILEGNDKLASTKLLIELEKNIAKDEAKDRLGEDGTGAPINILGDSRYKDDLYKYLMHVINNYDITSIPIAQELKPLINPTYLGGENIIELKRVLVDVYYRHKNSDPIQQKDLKSDGQDNKLLPYLSIDVRLKMATTDPLDDMKREKYLALLNTYITNNVSFKQGNPLPKQIIDKMTAERQNTGLKDVIDKYFSILNMILTSILILIAYVIYHTIVNKTGNMQLIALASFIILILLGMFAWIAKLSIV